MNIQLIEKLIQSNNESCPEFTFSNPLLHKDISQALSKSFVKILKISKESANNNLRLEVLRNIRKMCKIEPEEHMEVDENLTELLCTFFDKQIQDNYNLNNVDKQLDAFLLRRSKEISINSLHQSNLNPEVAQALLNLTEKISPNDNLTKDIIHWNQNDRKCLTVIRDLWNSDQKNEDLPRGKSIDLLNDTSIKIKADIEKYLIEMVCSLFQDESVDKITNNDFYKNLVNTSSVSSECFQICISILNTIYIMSNFHVKIQDFICKYIKRVKSSCTEITFAVLYPHNLRHVVTLLDFNLEVLPVLLRQEYVNNTVRYLKMLDNTSETELLLLLSHFPQWYNIYYEQ